MRLPATSTRVVEHSPTSANLAIQEATEQRIAWYTQHPEAIPTRLDELTREWDMERTLELNAATIGLLGFALSPINKKFLILPGVVFGFLAQHALQGWCPPIEVFRRLGFRTQTEIERERHRLEQILANKSA